MVRTLCLALAAASLALPAHGQARPEEHTNEPSATGGACGAVIWNVLDLPGVERWTGFYAYIGPGWLPGGPGATGVLGLFHQHVVGVDLAFSHPFSGDLGTFSALALRFVPLRFGLSTPWHDGKVAPDAALFLGGRIGGGYQHVVPEFTPTLGLDAELMLGARFVIALRVSAWVIAHETPAPPTVAAFLAFGVAPGSAYAGR